MYQYPGSIQYWLALYGPIVLTSLATLVVGWLIAKSLTGILDRIMRKAKVEPTLIGFATTLAYAMLMTMVVISAIQKLGVPTTSFVAVVGAAGLAIGLALQSSLANFASGVMVIIFRPFKAGDFVEAGGVSGTIEEVQVFATILKTPDNKRVIVPNAAITSGTITNYSTNDTRRIDFVFGIGYGDDIKQAKDVLQDIIAKDKRILREPAAAIAVAELADNSVNIIVRPWVNTSDYWSVHCDIIELVKLRFDAENISFPFPQRDVHLHQVA